MLLLTCLVFSGLSASHPTGKTDRARLSALRTAPPAKRALLVGISEYERGNPTTDWWNLNTERDVEAMRRVLVDKFQFKQDEIKILKTKAETTHNSIVGTFRSFLIEPTKPGDVIYFHYSGHGGQVPDTDTPDNPIVGDELDGLDECLIPSDYVSRKDGSKNIRDDEIGILLNELKQKQPANVTLSFDSCFSGTITRGGRHKVRGQKWEGQTAVTLASKTRGGEEKSSGGLLKRGTAIANDFIVITATRNDQLDTETEDESGQEIGPLSYVLSKALSSAGPQTTYRDIFERVNELMSRIGNLQNPQLEGDLDKVVMAGVGLPPQPYIPVSVDSKGNITLQAGELQDMTRGSRFALFSAGTKDFINTAPKAESEIVKLDLTVATLRLTNESVAKGVQPQDLLAARAVEKSHQYGDNRLKVSTQNLNGILRGKEVIDSIRSIPLVNSDATSGDRWDVRICPVKCPDQQPSTSEVQQSEPNSVVLQRQDGSVVATIATGDGQLKKIQEALEGEARWRFVNALANKDLNSQIEIALRLVPVEVEIDPESGKVRRVKRDREIKRTDGGHFELSEGDMVMIELKNTGGKDAFVTVLDLQNNGKIGPIWPHPDVKVQENKIAADKEWHRLPLPFVFRIEKPYGKETYKAIATSEPADFSPLLDREFLVRGASDPSLRKLAQSPLGQLLTSITMGQRSPSVDPANWTTAVEVFVVKERK